MSSGEFYFCTGCSLSVIKKNASKIGQYANTKYGIMRKCICVSCMLIKNLEYDCTNDQSPALNTGEFEDWILNFLIKGESNAKLLNAAINASKMDKPKPKKKSVIDKKTI